MRGLLGVRTGGIGLGLWGLVVRRRVLAPLSSSTPRPSHQLWCPTGMPTLTPSTRRPGALVGLLRIIQTTAVHDDLSRLTRAGSSLPAQSKRPRPSAPTSLTKGA